MRNLLAQLKNMLGSENFFDDRASIVSLSHFSPPEKDTPLPLAALYPRHEGHIRDILHFCREYGFSLRIMGGGTSFGQAKPLQKELLLLTGGLDRIMSLEEENHSLLAQSGLSLVVLKKRLASSKLFLPFQFSSTSPATLGGLVAANTPGLYALGYGCPGNHVQELEVFLSSGEKTILSCQNDQPLRPPFPLAPLFIGSRGHLGLISAVKINLLPRPPAQISFIITCKNNLEAVQSSSAILNSGLAPAAMEIISANAAQSCGLSARPALYLSFFGPSPFLEEQKVRLGQLFEASSTRLLSGEENASFISAYAVCFIKLQAQTTTSTSYMAVCPQNRLSCYIENLEEILREYSVEADFGIHAGLAYIKVLIYGSSSERINLARKRIFTVELMLNNRMDSEKDAELAPEEWRNYHDEDMHLARNIAEIFDPFKIFSASLFQDGKQNAPI